MRLKSLIRVAAFLGLSALSPAVLAGPSDHSFAWTAGSGGSAELWLDGGSVVLTATNRGWIAQNGTNNFGGASGNYIAGVCGSSDACLGDDLDRHNYFVFDLSDVHSVSSAELRLLQPASPDGFASQWPSLTYSLYDVTAGYPTDPIYDQLALYADLGSGISFGSVVLDSSSNGTTVVITFNAAGISELYSSLDSQFYVGGAVAVPEPETYAMLLAGLGLLGFAARRRKLKEAATA